MWVSPDIPRASHQTWRRAYFRAAWGTARPTRQTKKQIPPNRPRTGALKSSVTVYKFATAVQIESSGTLQFYEARRSAQPTPIPKTNSPSITLGLASEKSMEEHTNVQPRRHARRAELHSFMTRNKPPNPRPYPKQIPPRLHSERCERIQCNSPLLCDRGASRGLRLLRSSIMRDKPPNPRPDQKQIPPRSPSDGRVRNPCKSPLICVRGATRDLRNAIVS